MAPAPAWKFKKGELSPARIVLLEEFDGRGWDARALKRKSLYEALLAYLAEFGSSRVPREYRTADGYRLGQWVVNRRVDHKKGKLTPDRIAQLEAVDGWAWKVS